MIWTRIRPAAMLALAGIPLACGGDAGNTEVQPPEPSEMVVFVYDRSNSITDHSLELAQQLTRDRILELDHGDRIVGMQLLQLSLAEAPQRWSQNVPIREVEDFEVRQDSVNRARFLMDANVLLSQLAAPGPRTEVDGTDILSTMHDVGEEIRAYPEHVATLYLFSDMLQSNRQIDMEGLRRMPSETWVRQAAGNGTLPDLSGLCVMVVGARVDTDAAQRVKSFWTEYFEATGATLDSRNYVLRPVRLPSAPCSAAAA